MNKKYTVPSNSRGWVVFDGACRLCVVLAARFTPLLHRHGFGLEHLQTPWVQTRLGGNPANLLAEMGFITPGGAVYRGADAILAVAADIGWARPLYWLSFIPGIRNILRAAYGWIARRRHCLTGACQVPATTYRVNFNFWKWLPALLLPIFAFAAVQNRPAWELMWVMALALFAAAKWITLFPFLGTSNRIPTPRLAAFAFLWPGMDVAAFCANAVVPAPRPREWVRAVVTTVFGATLLWGVTPLADGPPLLAGWVGMVGLVLLLHFGFFHLLSLTWRLAGVNAQPIMKSPGASKSLHELWGGRWNAAFTDLMETRFLTPLARRLGPRRACFTIFAASGLLHELLISVPARGGYGLPTLYFVVQGLGLSFERTAFARRIGLGRAWRGWLFVVFVAGIPVFYLFHPTFVHRVILPMLHAIGATGTHL